MNFLLRRKPCPSQAAAVEALFAENLSAQERAGKAAESVGRASDQTRDHYERLRQEIVARTEYDRWERPQPPTSEVRALVDDVLSKPGLRGLTAKDQS